MPFPEHPLAKPWNGVGFILDFEGREAGEVAFILKVPRGEVTIAHLRAAAAAPDLLEALKALTEEVCDYATVNSLGDPEQKHNVRLARAAIAKAEGRQP